MTPQQKRYSIIGLAVLILTLVLVLLAYRRDNTKGYRMVAVLPLTGNLAVVGTPKREAMELALEQGKQEFPDVQLTISFQDSLGQAKDGVAALNQAISLSKPDFAFVDVTPIVDATLPIIQANKLPTFAGSAQAGITKRSEFVFRIFPGGDQEIRMLGDYLKRRNPKGVFVVHSNELYGRSVNDLLKARNQDFTVVGSDEYALSDRDFRTQLTKARDSKAEVIVLLGYGSEYQLILQQAHELGISPSSIVSNLGAVNIGVIKLAPELTEGMTFAGPQFALRTEQNSYAPQARLIAAYRKKYGRDPDFRVAFVYDTIMLLLKALHDQGNPQKASTQLMEIKDYEGASGRLTITANRDALVDLVLARYTNGVPTKLEGN